MEDRRTVPLLLLRLIKPLPSTAANMKTTKMMKTLDLAKVTSTEAAVAASAPARAVTDIPVHPVNTSVTNRSNAIAPA
jgi:hypothetical protein